MRQRLMRWVAVCGIVLWAGGASAVTVIGPQGRNTAPPTGLLLNSGWQLQGDLGGFLATPISPTHILSADHIGAGVGTTFTFPNASGTPVTYTTISRVKDPNTDLVIYELNGTVHQWASLWDPSVDGNETGRQTVMFGRGTARGAPVIGPSSAPAPRGGRRTSELKGWLLGSDDRVRSWGTNTILGVANAGGTIGQLLAINFSQSAGPDEGMLTPGDSGGAMFIRNNLGQWKLAAIHYAAELSYRTTASGGDFTAALFDTGGYYVNTPSGWQLRPEQVADIPALAYSTRVGARLSWINGVIGASFAASVPEPSGLGLMLPVAWLLRRASRTSR